MEALRKAKEEAQAAADTSTVAKLIEAAPELAEERRDGEIPVSLLACTATMEKLKKHNLAAAEAIAVHQRKAAELEEQIIDRVGEVELLASQIEKFAS